MSLIQVVDRVHAEEAIAWSSSHLETAQEGRVQTGKNLGRSTDPQIIAVKNQDRVRTAIKTGIEGRWLETQVQEKKIHHLEPEESALLSSIKSPS
jgi:hypothetical protein